MEYIFMQMYISQYDFKKNRPAYVRRGYID